MQIPKQYKPSGGWVYPERRLKRLLGELGQNGFTRDTSQQLEASAGDDFNPYPANVEKMVNS